MKIAHEMRMIHMRTFDFAPLHRATVGFDQIADMMDRVMSNEAQQPTYPPYNIEKTADDAYRISVAVAGFSAAGNPAIQSWSKATPRASTIRESRRGILPGPNLEIR